MISRQPSRTALPRRSGRLLVLATLVAAVGLAWSSAAVGATTRRAVHPATTTPFNTNLIKNGGAEAGSASSDGYSGVAIPGWEVVTDSQFTVVKYGTSAFPTKHEGNRINGHKQFFTTGQYDSTYGQCDDAFQDVFIKGHNSAVDGHHVKVVLTARLATYLDQTDTAHINLYFGTRNDNSSNGGAHVKPQTATYGKFNLVSVSKVLPAQTGEIKVRLWASHTIGYCDAYFDNISLKIVSV